MQLVTSLGDGGRGVTGRAIWQQEKLEKGMSRRQVWGKSEPTRSPLEKKGRDSTRHSRGGLGFAVTQTWV